MILGTAAYMSPEQARGTAIDKRADIWGFGCVFYEMVCGTRAFPGHHLSDVLASVMAREPDWALLPPDLSPVLVTFLTRCLQKDPKQRVHDIADVRLALDGAFDTAQPPLAPPPPVPPRRGLPLLIGTALVAAAAAAAISLAIMRAPEPAVRRISRLEVASSGASTLTLTDNQRHIAITPDGTRLVYVGNRGTQLFVRRLDSLESTPVYTRFPGGRSARPTASGLVSPTPAN